MSNSKSPETKKRSMSKPRKRLVVELGEKSESDLDKLIVSEETNKTTVVNRSIQLFQLIREIEQRGGSVILEDPERGRAVLILPH